MVVGEDEDDIGSIGRTEAGAWEQAGQDDGEPSKRVERGSPAPGGKTCHLEAFQS